MTIRWEAAAGSHVGKVRRGNEDSYRVDPERGIFLVADGMGGHVAGEVASALVAESTADALAELWDAGAGDDEMLHALEHSFHKAQQRLIGYSSEDPALRGMGTTLTVLQLASDGSWNLGHIGDSRAYRLRDSRLEQLTLDHTWVQREVEEGRLTATAAARHHLSHILTRVLSDDGEAAPDILRGNAVAGDLLLLGTDGLSGMLEDEDIREILLQDLPLAARTQRLIDAANARGGIDNVTAVLIRIAAAPSPSLSSIPTAEVP